MNDGINSLTGRSAGLRVAYIAPNNLGATRQSTCSNIQRTHVVPVRVIMITANEGSRHKAYAEMLGVDDYIRKPFAMDRLLESVDRLLGK